MDTIKNILRQVNDSLVHSKDSAVATTNFVLDSLQQYPITKGLLPAGATASPALFMDNLEVGLKITLLLISIVTASLTGYAKWLHVKHLKKNNGKQSTD